MSRLVLKLALLCAVAAAVADARGARAGRDQNGRRVLPSRRTTITNKDGRQEDIELCTTPECVVAAGDILARMDRSVDPCDDFYEFACGSYLRFTELEDTESKTGTFYEVRDLVDVASLAILTEPVNSRQDADSLVRLKDMHTACGNEAAIAATGLDPFVDMLTTGSGDPAGGMPLLLNNWLQGQFSWEQVAGMNSRYWLSDSIVSTTVFIDQQNTDRNVIYVDQPGLILSRDVYLNEADFPDYVTAYKTFIVDAVSLIADDMGLTIQTAALNQAADDIYELEKTLATIIIPYEDRGDLEELYTATTLTALNEDYAPAIDWTTYMDNFFDGVDVTIADDEDIVNVEPDYFNAFMAAFDDLDQETVANYLYLRRLYAMADEGPTELQDILFAFNSALSGQEVADSRDIKCVSIAQSELKGYAYALGTAYVNGYVPVDTKDIASDLVDDLRQAFGELLDENEWMSEETIVLAQEKLDLIEQLVAWDDSILDNDGIDAFYDGAPTMNPNTHFENVKSTVDYNVARYLGVLRDRPDRSEWITPASVVNAFYSPEHNSISFPSGILQPPFFQAAYPRYLNYGGIGVVMGHEITHGFDDRGSQYDGTGMVSDWWTEEDRANFDERAQCFIDQYSEYEVENVESGDNHVNGELTIGENIADNGGLHESFRAYMNSKVVLGEEPRLPGLESYTPEQLFFISYSQVWCEVATEESAVSQLQSDVHSPGRYRVIGPLSNSADFVENFQCEEGLMNRGDDMCVLW